MATGNYGFRIYSNDGSTVLKSIVDDPNSTIVIGDGSVISNGVSVYTYTGTKTFKGLATTPNATAPVYVSGDTIALTEYSIDNFYIVEGDPTPTEDTVYIKYNNETVNSITKGQTCTLQCKTPTGKATQMLSDIEVEFAAGGGGDEPAPVGSPLRKITLTAVDLPFRGTINVYTSAGTGLLDVDFTGDFTLSIPMERLELVAASGYFFVLGDAVDCDYSSNSYDTVVELTNIALAQEGSAEFSFTYVSSGAD